MQTFKSTQNIEAGIISSIDENADNDSNPVLYVKTGESDNSIVPIVVSDDYMARHQPQVGGYYIKYYTHDSFNPDGYESFRSAEAFEAASIPVNTELSPDAQPILSFFTYNHLPPHLKEISSLIAELAFIMDHKLDDNSEEKSVGLRKLLEAKDCLVRAATSRAG